MVTIKEKMLNILLCNRGWDREWGSDEWLIEVIWWWYWVLLYLYVCYNEGGWSDRDRVGARLGSMVRYWRWI